MLWSLLPLASLCLAHPAHVARSSGWGSGKVTIHQVTQFPNGTWIEDVAVRSNGKLLVTTLLPAPNVWQVNPAASPATQELIATIPGALATVGIAEISPDVFAVAAGNISASAIPVPQSFSVWKVDVSRSKPAVSKLFDTPLAGALDGITTATGQPNSDWLCIADNSQGLIWRANWRTGKYSVALNDSTTQLVPGFPVPIGANGVHVKNGNLYYTNSGAGFFKVAIDSTCKPTGSPVTVASFAGGDGFALDGANNALVAAGGLDQFYKVTPAGAVQPLNFTNADAAVLIQGSTSAAFGRTSRDSSTLYDVTNGGLSGLAGPAPVGGLVLAFSC